jgi:predicted acylesterase/phospholipase RssA
VNAGRADPRRYDYSHPSRSCDMVMKGGITSGVVYPHAVCELAQVYRFRSVGGASAGAIAAAATAAAELGRANDGFAKLAELPDWLGTNLFSVFQPQRETRGLFAILTEAITKGPRHLLRVLGAALRGFWLPTLLGALPGILLLVLALALASGWGLAIALVAALLVLVIGAALGLLVGILRTATRALPGNYFGLCTGMAEPETVQPQPLTIWLGELLERLAGRQPGSPPLTFGDLWGGDTPGASESSIRLEMMTTNLTNRRPHRLPWDERVFYFRPSELYDLFPDHVVKWMEDHPPAPHEDAGDQRESELRTRLLDGLVPWPGAKDLPVIVAARMSLSFPLLISAVPLWAVDMGEPGNQEAWAEWTKWLAEHADVWDEIKDDLSKWPETPAHKLVAGRCWFSDGGISSNFPVHFFDAPVPTRPTFAIDLAGFRPGETPDPDECENVWLPENNQGGLLENWYAFDAGSGLGRLVGFVSGMVRTMQNRVDNAQMRVPGYRDRVVHVKFTKEEGGMNLTMPPQVIGALTERGRCSGEKLIERFHEPPQPGRLSWDNHRWVRFRSSLAVVGRLLESFAGGYTRPPEAPGERTYAQLAARGDTEPPSSYRWRRDAQELLAEDAVARVVALAAVLDASDQSLSEGGPSPEPEARIVPRV